MRAAFFTLGCKVNKYETDIIIKKFIDNGFEITEPGENADVFVINSCTVTSTGDKKTLQMLRRFRRHNLEAVICLCGCYPQAFPEKASLLMEADIITGTKNKSEILELVLEHLKYKKRITKIEKHEKGDIFEPILADDYSSTTRAFVKIQDGCDRFCTYCIIPHARGRMRSKSLEDIKKELASLAESGFKEIVLVGINLSNYGTDTGLRLIDAIKAADGICGIERIRLGSIEPEMLTEEDIREMAGIKKLCGHFHLSLQSGCDEILKRMRRQYTAAEYKTIADNLRSNFENCAVTTDIMVGFPGESEENHAASLSFVRSMNFAHAHVFQYSKRQGTPAADMAEQLPQKIKRERSAEMLEVTDKSAAEFLSLQKNRSLEVYFETFENGYYRGYSKNYCLVKVKSPEDICGKILKVTVTGVGEGFCFGEINALQAGKKITRTEN